MLGSPNMIGITKRDNKTFKNILRSMIFCTTLSHALWGDALNTSVYILNKVLTNVTKKISYELWTGKEPILNNLLSMEMSNWSKAL